MRWACRARSRTAEAGGRAPGWHPGCTRAALQASVCLLHKDRHRACCRGRSGQARLINQLGAALCDDVTEYAAPLQGPALHQPPVRCVGQPVRALPCSNRSATSSTCGERSGAGAPENLLVLSPVQFILRRAVDITLTGSSRACTCQQRLSKRYGTQPSIPCARLHTELRQTAAIYICHRCT